MVYYKLDFNHSVANLFFLFFIFLIMQKTRDIEIDETDIFKNDLLDRQTEIENLTPIILNFDDSLVLALDSPWGAGKTTFVGLWQAYLKKQGKQSICFNAWETDYAEDP